MKKPCRKCAPKVNSRLLLNLSKQPKTAIVCKEFFYKSDILKENFQKALKKITLFFFQAVCHPYDTLMYSFVTRMYMYVIVMSLVCTRILSVCHWYVLVCHLSVTHTYSYVICMLLEYGFTINGNHVSFIFFNISKESVLEMYHAEFLQNNSPNLLSLLPSNCIIQNSKLTKNNVSWKVSGIKMSSTIQLNHVAFTRNRLLKLLRVKSRSNTIIQKNTLIENVLWKVYDSEKSCTIQLNNVAFIRNR